MEVKLQLVDRSSGSLDFLKNKEVVSIIKESYDVDLDDLNLILSARNTPASGPDDPKDLDGDGIITVLDARKLVLLCTRPRCVTE